MSTIEFNTYITDAEWEVMRVVWANDRVTSKKVISVLQEKMDWTQSTIKTILGRLVGKGVLNTEQEGRNFIYTANIEEKEAVNEKLSSHVLPEAFVYFPPGNSSVTFAVAFCHCA